MTPFKTGDIVCFRASFLRSVQWFTDVPLNGKILSIEGDIAKIEWSDEGVSGSHTKNLILESEKHKEPV
jgi:hypothetical protein